MRAASESVGLRVSEIKCEEMEAVGLGDSNGERSVPSPGVFKSTNKAHACV